MPQLMAIGQSLATLVAMLAQVAWMVTAWQIGAPLGDWLFGHLLITLIAWFPATMFIVLEFYAERLGL